MAIAAPGTTTLTAALDSGLTRRFQVGSTSGINGAGSLTSPQSVLIVGSEMMLVEGVPSSGVVEVSRGFGGTKGRAHAAAVTVTFGARSIFTFNEESYPRRIGLVGDAGTLPDYVLPVGGSKVDPDTGNEYSLVDCQAAMAIGSWVVLSGAGLASALASTSKGRVGVVVETVGGSDTLSWVLTAGTFASTQFTSDVTTGCELIAGAGIADILTTTGGNLIQRATCIVVPTSVTTDYGTVYMDHPWVSGVFFNPGSTGT